MAKPYRNPEQGSLLLPGMAGQEIVPVDGSSFAQQEFLDSVYNRPSSQEVSIVNIIDRNSQLDRLLGYAGVMSELLPALEAKEDKIIEKVLKNKFGSEYEVKVEEMRGMYAFHTELFDALFAKMWHYDEEIDAGIIDEADSQFEEDKSDFLIKFMKSKDASTSKAKSNRRSYRNVLDRQQMAYQEKDIGVWITNKARQARIATKKRINERARKSRKS